MTRHSPRQRTPLPLPPYDRAVTEELIVAEQRDRVRRISFNRPGKLNAFTPTMLDGLFSAIDDAVLDPGTHVIVLAGVGRAFSSGADIGSGATGTDTADAPGDMVANRARVDRWLGLWSCPKPIIAQVHGYCLGSANEIVACCDLVVCGESTKIGMAEAREFALPPTLAFWPLRIGSRKAKELLFTGRILSGADAVALGMANEVVADDALAERVDELAATIAEVPVARLAVVKQAVNAWDERMGLRAAALGGAEYHAIFHQASSWAEVVAAAQPSAGDPSN